MKNIRDSIINLFSTPGYIPSDADRISELLEIPVQQIISELDKMKKESLILESKRGRFGLPSSFGYKTGRFTGVKSGNYGFVIPDDHSEDIFVSERGKLGAWSGDKVLVKPTVITNKNNNSGEIIRIIDRRVKSLTGDFVLFNRKPYLKPDDPRLPEVEIAKKDLYKASFGDKIAVEIRDYGTGSKPPKGRIIACFGKNNTRQTVISSILFNYSIQQEFSPLAIQYAESITKEITDSEIKNRLDLRDKLIFTIDPETAKDLDDAVSIECSDDGIYTLGVHIADVSSYIPHESPLDNEAFERGTSVYYANKVIPMLPTSISDDICSLNPNEDKLTLSCIMKFDGDGGLINSEIRESVIRSSERMTYSDCNKLLENSDPDLVKKYEHILEPLTHMYNLAQKLNNQRLRQGSLELETTESKIICNSMGDPIDIIADQRGVAENIIEEFMLAANKSVAEYLFWLDKPAIYRVHPEPEDDKLSEFIQAVSVMGYNIKKSADGKLHQTKLQSILKQARGKPEQPIINNMLLRVLPKAFYSPECKGHYGLTTQYYCHFTSPIRRYPDLVVHRILKLILGGRLDEKTESKMRNFALAAAKISSERELAADNSERDIEKIYKAEYMQKYIGDEFEGIISSVLSFGFFVTLKNTVEGLVPTSSLEDTSFHYDKEKSLLYSSRTKTTIKPGMTVKVKCIKANPMNGEIDFELIEISEQ